MAGSMISGSGDGYGYWDGYWDGYGEQIGEAAGHPVRLLTPWPYVAAGCQVHSLETWRERWREIADAEAIRVTPEEAQALIAAAEKTLRRAGR